ncbi:thiamine-triphosphatase, partial [Aspergillus brunneoviolaceus CBS 621.78]
LLEVERKFRRMAVDKLHLNSGHLPFHGLLYRGTQIFHDTYYDSADFLSARGVRVRRRNNTWQVKIRRGENYSNSRFEELSTTAAISAYLAELTGETRSDATNQFGLTPMASFTTLRESWTADNDFTIVQDVTDFGHTVGEVELELRWNCRDDRPRIERERCRASKTAEMDERIPAFMRRYYWAFCVGVPKGKLTAYFERGVGK